MEVTLESKTFLLKAKTTESQVDLGKEIDASEALRNVNASDLHSEVQEELQK